MGIKGVVLAGGSGSRLDPLTRVTNKHLLPVYDRPMIFYPVEAMRDSGIEEVLIVTGGNDPGDFLRLLGNGREIGLKHIEYAYQQGNGGIAHALALAEHFAAGGPLCVMLGDNLVHKVFGSSVKAFLRQGRGARIHLSPVPAPQRFGVPEFDKDRIVRIVEKPSDPPSTFAVTGIYMYDSRVFDIVRKLKPSGRGELEITDVNNDYIARGEMSWAMLDGWWTDAGTFESLHEAGNLVRQYRANNPEIVPGVPHPSLRTEQGRKAAAAAQQRTDSRRRAGR
ncbi:MAG TPA: sugar phosphate nucleotidyltransferase [Candidatus Polarisedimenticolia bacterium]|nr:sugar phosphate nucleotidyltransferase [Candidatus Polarisedimenticolia bacterium]